MKKLLLLTLAAMLAFASCKKDNTIDPDPPVNTTRNFSQIVTSVNGVVVDRNNAPVADATVRFGALTTTTDTNGFFNIKNGVVMENRAFVTVEKEGYFHGSRTFFAYSAESEFVRIALLEKTVHGTITASGGTVSTPEGVQLTFPANAVADANGNLYTGTVEVAANYLDPTASDIGQIMPGDLRGITTDNVEEGLTTYGMVAVELIGSGGELLNVAAGKTVTLNMPVASDQQGSAPAEIPLWYFDEVAGVWKEEGTATLQGNEYVGEVAHFTFWNCDISWDVLYLDGSVTLEGAPFEDVYVCLTFDNNGGWISTACDITNTNGVFAGQVPANTTFTLEIFSGSNCGNSIYSQQVGPFTDDTTLDPIDIDPASISNLTINITGFIEDCDNNPITDGYVMVDIGGYQRYEYTTDGSIDMDFINCDLAATELSVIAVDANGLTQSDPTTFAISNAVDIGTVQACVTLDEFIIVEFDGQTYNLLENVSLWDSLGAGTGEQFLSGSNGNQGWFSLSTSGNGLGTFDVNSFWASGIGGSPNGLSSQDMQITFTVYSNTLGGTCEGTFSGTAPDPTGAPLPLTGSFKAIRDF
ncbi:MAG: carboxypeptidase-like regulatory domain-containing protein [Bacteroidota bacterium]